MSSNNFPLCLSVKITVFARILCLKVLFSLFGFSVIVDSNNAKCLISRKIKQFLMNGESRVRFPPSITLVVILSANVLMA